MTYLYNGSRQSITSTLLFDPWNHLLPWQTGGGFNHLRYSTGMSMFAASFSICDIIFYHFLKLLPGSSSFFNSKWTGTVCQLEELQG